MAEIKVYLSEQLDKRFRKAAMDAFGYGRGSLSRAAEEAFFEWCQRRERIDPLPSLVSLTGKLGEPTGLSSSREARDQGSTLGSPG